MSAWATACAAASPWTLALPGEHETVELTREHGKSCVRLRQSFRECYDGIAAKDVAVSRTGEHVAWAARRGNRWMVAVDGLPGDDWDAVGAPLLSDDGRHVAYAAGDGRRWRVVFDRRAGPAFDDIVEGTLTFSRDGEHIAYAGRRNGIAYVVADTTEGPPFAQVRSLRITPRGEHVAYLAPGPTGVSAVLDGTVRGFHREIGALALSARGDLAYTARDSTSWHVISATGRLGPFATVRSLLYGRDGAGPLSFVARADEREMAFVGEARGWHDHVSGPVFSESHWGFIAEDSGAAGVYLDGHLVAHDAGATGLALAPTSRRFAYVSHTDSSAHIVDDRGRGTFDVVVDRTLQFVDDEHWVALAGTRSRRQLIVILDGKPTTRRVNWPDLVWMSAQPDAEDLLRAWVGALGRLELRAMRDSS